MKTVNAVTLLGNVTSTPEVKSLAGGETVCTFGLATVRLTKGADGQTQRQPEFHNLVVWGKLAESCAKYVKKGKPLYVEGHLKTGSWEKPEGVRHYKTEVFVDDFVLLASKAKSAENEDSE